MGRVKRRRRRSAKFASDPPSVRKSRACGRISNEDLMTRPSGTPSAFPPLDDSIVATRLGSLHPAYFGQVAVTRLPGDPRTRLWEGRPRAASPGLSAVPTEWRSTLADRTRGATLLAWRGIGCGMPFDEASVRAEGEMAVREGWTLVLTGIRSADQPSGSPSRKKIGWDEITKYHSAEGGVAP